MQEIEKASGVGYPEITLGGITYTLRISREIWIFRLSELGVTLTDLIGPKRHSALIKTLYVIIAGRYQGTVEDLVTLIAAEGKLAAVDVAISDTIKKVFPLTGSPEAATAGQVEAKIQ